MKAPLKHMRASILLLTTLAGGCAGDGAEMLFVKPGRYDYMACPELATDAQNVAKREEELKVLIARAEKDAFGSFIATTSYGGDYLKLQGEQKMLAEASAKKNCPPVDLTAQPSPPPVPAKKPKKRN
jgi:hypothetical protein